MAIETFLTLYKQAGHAVPEPSPVVPRRRAGYDAAGTGRRAHGWTTKSEDINSLLFANADILRSRSHDAVRKNPWASNAIDSYTANAIGSGIKPQSLFQDESADKTRKVRDLIHKEWLRWTDQSDFTWRTDFYGQQELAFRSMFEAGEVLIRMHMVDDLKLRVPLQLQILEAEHLPYNVFKRPDSVLEGNDLQAGIEFDRDGRRQAYHVYRDHPGSSSFFTGARNELVRVPDREMIHMFRTLRPGQLRGEPWLSQVLVALHDLDKFTDAALVAKLLTKLMAGFLETPDVYAQSDIPGSTTTEDPSITEADIQPGTIHRLPVGTKLNWSTPPSDEDFAPFVNVHLQSIAAGCGLAEFQLTGDLSRFNFASCRAGLLEFRRKCEQRQYSVVCFQLNRKVYKAWFEAAVLSGALPFREDFIKRRADYLDVEWITPGWQYVNPLQDVTAAVMEIDHGLNSRANAVSARGLDIETIDRQNAADQKRAGDLYVLPAEKKAAAARVAEALLAEPEEQPRRVIQ